MPEQDYSYLDNLLNAQPQEAPVQQPEAPVLPAYTNEQVDTALRAREDVESATTFRGIKRGLELAWGIPQPVAEELIKFNPDVPLDQLKENQQIYQKQVQLKKLYDVIMQKDEATGKHLFPNTVELLRNPRNAARLQGDEQNVTKLERLMTAVYGTTGQKVWAATKEGTKGLGRNMVSAADFLLESSERAAVNVMTMGQGALTAEDLGFDVNTPEGKAAYQKFMDDGQGYNTDTSGIHKALQDIVNDSVLTAAPLPQSVSGGEQFALDVVGTAPQIAGTLLSSVAAGLVSGGTAVPVIAGSLFMGGQIAGSTNESLAGIPYENRAPAVVGNAIAQSLLEALSLHYVLPKLQVPFRTIEKGLVRNVMQGMKTSPAELGAIARTFAGELAAPVISEGVTEALQEYPDEIFQGMARAMSEAKGDVDKASDIFFRDFDLWDTTKQAAWSGMVGSTFGLLAVGGAINAATETAARNRKVIEAAKVVAEMRNPEAAKEVAGKLAEATGAKDEVAFILPAEFQAAFGERALEVAEKMGVADEYQQALNAGREMQFPMFAAALAGEEDVVTLTPLMQYASVDPERVGILKKSLMQVYEEASTVAQTISEEAAGLKKLTEDMFSAGEAVKIKGWNKDAAKSVAALHYAFARTIGEGQNLTPEQFLAQRGLAIETATQDAAERMAGQSQMQEGDYRIAHTAPRPAAQSSGDDPAMVYPDDLYGEQGYRYYGHGGDAKSVAMDKKTVQILRTIKGMPEKEIKIYRAAPDAEGVDINPGDWVTVNRDYAKDHGERQYDDGKYKIIEKRVKAKEIFTDGNSIHEWGYWPEGSVPDTSVDPRINYQRSGIYRGAYTAAADGGRGIITLFENGANLSTLLHETGHYFMDELFRAAKTNPALQPLVDGINEFTKEFDTDAELAPYYQRYLASLPRFGRTPFDQLTDEQKADVRDTAKAEKFARGFEQYFREGKAPSVELANAFARFRSWLVAIYKALTGVMDIQLDENIKGVFDRMLATEEEIYEAKAFYETKENIADLLVPQENKERVIAARKLADAEFEGSALRTAILNHMKATGEDERFRKEAIEEAQKEPLYIAAEHIASTGGIDRALLEELLGKERTERLLTKFPKLVGSSRDMDALDAYAVNTGEFVGGYDLLAILAESPSPYERVKEIHQQKRLAYERKLRTGRIQQNQEDAGEGMFINFDEHGNVLEDYITEERLDYLTMLAVAAQQRNAKDKALQSLDPKALRAERLALKQAAQEHLDSLPVGKSARPDLFLKAVAKQGKDATMLAKKGDLIGAAEALRKQALNAQLASLAMQIRSRKQQLEKKMEKAAVVKNNNGKRTVSVQYTDLIRNILNHFGLSDQKPEMPERMVTLDALMAMEDDDVFPMDRTPPAWLLGFESRQPEAYQGLTLPQLEELNDFVAMLRKQGSTEVSALARLYGQDGMTVEEVNYELVNQLAKHKTRANPVTQDEATTKVKELMDEAMAWTLSPKFLFKMADLNEDKGVFQKWMYNPLVEQDRKRLEHLQRINDKEMKTITAKIDALAKRISAERGWKFQIPGVPVPEVWKRAGVEHWTPEMVLSVVLNTGTENNMKALMGGYNWELDHIRLIAGVLTAEEVTVVNDIRSLLDSLFPGVVEANLAVYGSPVKKEEPSPFTFRSADGQYVTLDGGYYPLSYDPRMSLKVDGYAEKDILKQQVMSTQQRVSPRRNMVKSRSGATYPVNLSMTVLNRHLNDALTFTYMAETLNDISKLVKDKEGIIPITGLEGVNGTNTTLASAFQTVFGTDKFKQLIPFLSRVANPNPPAGSRLDRAIGWMQNKATVSLLALNIVSGVKNTSAMFSAVRRIGLWEYMKGAGNFYFGALTGDNKSPLSWVNFIDQQDPRMANRAKNLHAEMAKLVMRANPMSRFALNIGGTRVTKETLSELFMGFIRGFDAMVSYPAYIAVYNKVLNETGDPVQAKNKAYQVVADTQPNADALNQNAWQAGGLDGRHKAMFNMLMPLSGWTFRFGDIVRLQNYLMRNDAISLGQYAFHLFMDILAPSVYTAALVALIRGGDDEEDNKTFLLSSALDTLGYSFSWIPGESMVLGTARYGFGRASVENLALRGFALTGKLTGDLASLFSDKPRSAERIGWSLAETGAFWSGVPLPNAYKSYKDTMTMLGLSEKENKK